MRAKRLSDAATSYDFEPLEASDPPPRDAMASMGGNAAAINPLQRMPALVLDDGTVITESIAICRYFEAQQPQPSLFGAGAKDIALVEMWNRRAELNLLACVAHVFRHSHPAMKALEVPQVAEWAEANKPRVLEFIALLDGELKGRQFIAGDRYTVADITAMIAIDFMKPIRIAVPAGQR